MAQANGRETTKTAVVDDAACAHAPFPSAPPMPELIGSREPGGNLIDEVALSGQRRLPSHVRIARVVLALCVGIILGMAFILFWAVWF